MKKSQKIASKFYCELCDYNTSNKFDYNKHLTTDKHQVSNKLNALEQKVAKNPQYQCDKCNKVYNARNSLWYHKQKCNVININDTASYKEESTNCDAKQLQDMITDKDLMMALIKDNADFKSMLLKVLENGTNISNSNNVNCNNVTNKTFNLNFFLNETCKNAMNIGDFVNSIQPTFEDLEYVGRVGYVEGISNIIIKKLNEVEITERPFHCTDSKREVIHIKDNNEWNKETDDKPILTKAIKEVAFKNIQNIFEWQKANEGCTQADSRKNDLYLKITLNSMGGTDSANFNKIISKLSKKIMIDKS